MAKNDNDLFERLRQAGLRKQVAKTLSEIGEGAGKKARGAAQSAVTELRAIADELERRLPGGRPASTAKATGRTSRRSARTRTPSRTSRPSAAKPRATRSRATSASPATPARRTATATAAASGTRATTSARKPATTSARKPATTSARKPASASAAKSAAATKASPARAPRGANKAKILASLKAGPKTASVIAKETGIGTGTVGSTLSKLAVSGDVVKAERGYGLPS